MIVDTWEFQAEDSTNLDILPDGCRDLIWRKLPGEAPAWIISPLQNTTQNVRMEQGTWSKGYRLAAGIQIREDALLAALNSLTDEPELEDLLDTYSQLTFQTQEALNVLSATKSVGEASRILGVSPRSLQRLCFIESGRSPNYWLRLSRVRKAARLLSEKPDLKELAFDLDFADQAHMTREFKTWLGLTPAAFAKSSSLMAQVQETAYP